MPKKGVHNLTFVRVNFRQKVYIEYLYVILLIWYIEKSVFCIDNTFEIYICRYIIDIRDHVTLIIVNPTSSFNYYFLIQAIDIFN